LGQWGHSPRRENPPRLLFSPSIGALIPGWQSLADIQEFPAFKRDRLFLHQKKRDTDSQVSSPSKDERHRLAWLGDDGGFPPRRKKPPGARVGEGREQTARSPALSERVHTAFRKALAIFPTIVAPAAFLPTATRKTKISFAPFLDKIS
jgi:hypothetical protein